jgi:hypothetical protein
LPLAEEAIQRTAERWFELSRDSDARTRYDTAASKPELSKVLNNPLTLGFVCFIAHHGEVPTNEASVFERFVDHFLRRKWHHPSRWIVDDARIARMTNAATDVAWAMARQPHGEMQLLWKDSAVLGELEQLSGSTDAPHQVYDSGLLVPYGMLDSPTSPRFQRVRWMHRVIHEYFVARRLSQRVASHTEDWWPEFLAAALHPGWINALHQTCQLLGDTPHLHGLIEVLRSEVAVRDTPDEALTRVLSWLGRYCNCTEVRERLAALFGHLRRWEDALRFNESIAVKLALELPDGHARIGTIASAVANYCRTGRSPLALEHVDALLQASILDMSHSEDAEAVWLARLWADPLFWWPKALNAARTTGQLFVRWNFPGGVDPGMLAELADVLIQHFVDGPSQISAHTLAFQLDESLMSELRRREPDIPPRLALAVQIHRAYKLDMPDFTALVRLMAAQQHPLDVASLVPYVEEHTDWIATDPQQRELRPVVYASSCFSEFADAGYGSWDGGSSMMLTDDSLSLAEAIVDGFDVDRMHSPSASESLLWALCVLAAIPSAKVFDTLVAWYSDKEWAPQVDLGENQMKHPFLDHAGFVAVCNGQDWRKLVFEAREDIRVESRLTRAGLILCAAADTWTSPFNVRPLDRHFLQPSEAVNMWVEGVELLLRSEERELPGILREVFSVPDGLPGELRLGLARRIIELTTGGTGPIVTAARAGAERALADAGALAGCYEEIATPRNARTGPDRKCGS